MTSVLVCPDSFGGTLTAPEAAAAMARGWRAEAGATSLTCLPLADGGEGTLEVLERGARVRRARVDDPLGRPRTARWLQFPDGSAFVEVAEACGLHLVDPRERDPLRSTTRGVGSLLREVLAHRPTSLAVGLGGSATVDAGLEAVRALGLEALDRDGRAVPPGPSGLRKIAEVRTESVQRPECAVSLWADVRTPLRRSVAAFGPQKGLSAASAGWLEAAYLRWADILATALGGPGPDAPLTAAGGGLSLALAALWGIPPQEGAAVIARRLGLEELIAAHDLVVTGEGRVDATSDEGKVVSLVSSAAGALGIPVAVIAGQLERVPQGAVAWEAAAPSGPSADPGADVERAAGRLARRLTEREAIGEVR